MAQETYLERIKQLKSAKKITNEKLSEMTGIPLGTLSKLLAGISDSPKLANVVSIANALGCSLDYIVSGIPQNTNNYTLSADEIQLVEEYRSLDRYGQDLTRTVIAKENERVQAMPAAQITSRPTKRSNTPKAPEREGAKILSPLSASSVLSSGIGRRTLLLYDLPVSAGPGVALDYEHPDTTIAVRDTTRTRAADFALRISGNSMEPRYHDGDILLVQECETLEFGELGIFILDGNGFFKVYGGDRLYSLNPEYGDILLKDFEDVRVAGRVIGKLKKR